MTVTYLENFMLPNDVKESAERGSKIARSLKPLKTDDVFRFPHAVKHAAERFGYHTAAESAQEWVSTPFVHGGRALPPLDAARAYVARVVREKFL